jgi:hypothetical protein
MGRMGPEERPKYPPEWFTVGPWLPRWLPRRPRWLRWHWHYLLLVPVLVVALSFGWYAHWGWRMFYVNQTVGTLGGGGAISIDTDHSVYLIDEPLAITVTNHLSVPIFTQVTGPKNSYPCTIDLYVQWRSDSGQWINFGNSYSNSALGFGPGCDRDAGCYGTAPPHVLPPPPDVLAIAPGGAYTQVWHPSVTGPQNQPGTYRIVFRYSTDPAAVQVARVGDADLGGGAMPVPDTVKALQMELQTAISDAVQVVDDGIPPDRPTCHAV